MDVRPISPNVWVSGQIRPEDMAKLKDMGFRAIVGNRPDGEEPGQPEWAGIAAAAEAAGLAAAHIPVVPGQIGDDEALAFREVVTEFDKPVLAYCKTGNRAAQLWSLAARDRLSTDEVIRMAATAGYDLGPMRARIEQGLAG